MTTQEVMNLLIPLLVGGLGVPLVEVLKKYTKWEGLAALWMTFGVSTILAVIALFLIGGLSLSGLTPENYQAAIASVFGVATLIYRTMKEQKPPES